MKHTFAVLLVLALGVLAPGCTEAQLPPAAASAVDAPVRERCATSRRVIIGGDVSGSYNSVGVALEQIADLLENAACPGDEWIIRSIAAASYAPAAVIATYRFQEVPDAPPTPVNPFDGREYESQRRAWSSAASRFAAERRHAAAEIRQYVPPAAHATDVAGFFVKAGELLANTPAGRTRWVIVATDFLHNAGPLHPFSLEGAWVLVLAFEGHEVQEAQLVRAAWHESISAAGARQVFWRDASEPAVLELDTLVLGVPTGGT